MSGQFLQIRSVVKSFGPVVAVDDVSLDIEEGEIVCLLGPSGCGKTTLLRLVAGLEQPNAGAVRFDLRDVTSMPIHQRGFGMMFQSFALFPHFSVFENVAYGLKMQKLETGAIRSRVREMLDLVSMHGYESRSIDELSGGQQQRVALARALATQPRLLMLDEPLGALDRALRERLMLELRDIIKSVGVTAIYVTHDQSEAYAVADKIAIMDAGKLQQYAAPSTVFRRPASRFVAQFIGFENIITGYRLGNDLVETPIGALRCQAPVPGEDGEQVDLLIRPNALSLSPTVNSIRATHLSTVFRGRFSDVTLRIGQTDLVFEVEEPESLLSSLTGAIYLNPKAIQVIGA